MKKAQYLKHARHEDLKWFPHPSALFAEVMLPVACDQLSSLRFRQAFSNLANLEHIGFFFYLNLFFCYREFCHSADYVIPKVTA